MYNKMGGMDNCPDSGTPTPPVTSSPTSFTASARITLSTGGATLGIANQSETGQTSASYPGGTAITTPSGGGLPTITPPGLGENKTHGPVIARQVSTKRQHSANL